MIVKLSDDIVSPLAMGTHMNYECVKSGKTMLREYVGKWGLPEPFMASMLDDEMLSEACRKEGIAVSCYTKFERMAILTAVRALRQTDIMPDADDVLFIIATTKGNVELLDEQHKHLYPASRLGLLEAARQVSAWFRNPNTPLVVCNACISGLAAQLEAIRALSSGRYRYTVVIGADVLSPFIVSGFQSLQAMSSYTCRPFDEERTGLNLGEAAACIVYGLAEEGSVRTGSQWYAMEGAIRNDAFHLSGVSKKAEGAYRALKTVCEGQDVSRFGFINVHGTATMFNDEMEAVAIVRMGLHSLPVCGLKGYYGHTLGASGVLETLISMEALDEHIVLPTKGYEHIGVSREINISNMQQEVDGTAFLKMMSGFGGGNAVMCFGKGKTMYGINEKVPERFTVTHTVRLTEREVAVDGKGIPATGQGMQLLKSLYHQYIGNYPKFYKMDPLCKLGFIASELLLNAESESEGVVRFEPRDDRAVVLGGRNASLCADSIFQQSIQDMNNFYPSPSAFVYTLPNMVTGEIAIRNLYHGETSYFVQDGPGDMKCLMTQVLYSSGTQSVVGGWIDLENPERFEAILYIIKR